MSPEAKKQFSNILEELGKNLDITQDQHDKAVSSYEFVGNHLAADDSPLARYNPEILPQGSFMLGTMIKPVNEDDELDIDLVCRLEGKQINWTQFDLKKIVGDRLKGNGIIEKLLEIPDGRRCWTLQYAESAKFHMDILPAIVNSGYRQLLEKAFSKSSFDQQNADSLAIRITDKELWNYRISTLPEEWLKSNPFGYGIWFEERSSLAFQKAVMMSESVQPVPKYRKDKLPLQRVVQILKRHRDIMFNGDEDKPISIIITTLAAKAYRKETDILDALVNVIAQMPHEIEERYSAEHGRMIKWIQNPVNAAENFADKWPENATKEENFYKWISQVQQDVQQVLQQRGMHLIQESLSAPFGKSTVSRTFSNIADQAYNLRETGGMKMEKGTGILGVTGVTVKNHNFHGKD